MESQTNRKYLSINSKIRNVLLKKADTTKQKQSPFTAKIRLANNKYTKLIDQRFKKYMAHLTELRLSKLYLDKYFLIRARIKTDTYYSFCREYGISRMGDMSPDGTHTLELPLRHRENFAKDPRVSIVKCTDGSGDSAKALSLHLRFTEN
jgi:hypothetical protein